MSRLESLAIRVVEVGSFDGLKPQRLSSSVICRGGFFRLVVWATTTRPVGRMSRDVVELWNGFEMISGNGAPAFAKANLSHAADSNIFFVEGVSSERQRTQAHR